MAELRYDERTARRVINTAKRSSRYWSSERGRPYVPKNKDYGEYYGWFVKERKPWTPYMAPLDSDRPGARGRYTHRVRSVWIATKGTNRHVIGYALCGGSLIQPRFVKKVSDDWPECPRCKFTIMLRNGEL